VTLPADIIKQKLPGRGDGGRAMAPGDSSSCAAAQR
jgi:hypothetical protein